MTPTNTYLLSPYRLATGYPVSIDPEEAAAWLSGYFALWHPAVVAQSAGPPRAASAYDHDSPLANAVYCVPDGPAVYQPDDWPHRVAEAGGLEFRAHPDPARTRDQLWAVLPASDQKQAAPELVTAFAAVGFGYLLVEALFEAADHERLLNAEEFWERLTRAAGQVAHPDLARAELVHAAELLTAARESLSPNAPHWLDFVVLTAGRLDAPWPRTLHDRLPLTVAGPAHQFEQLAAEFPDRFAELTATLGAAPEGHLDLATGGYAERDDAVLPPESQLWNLTHGRRTLERLFGRAPTTYYRTRSAGHLHTPAFLHLTGFRHAVLAATDGADLPGRNAAVLNWPSPDGKTIDAIGRLPLPAADPTTFFNLAQHLHSAIASDTAPLVCLTHTGESPATGYAELVALLQLAPVVGAFTTVPQYLATHHYGEYLGACSADDFLIETLDDRVTGRQQLNPIGAFARHVRDRRRLDAGFRFLALLRTLVAPSAGDLATLTELEALEAALETNAPDSSVDRAESAKLETTAAQALAARLASRGAADTPGFLVLNPSGVTRRLGLEISGLAGAIPALAAVKASEFEGTTARLVVEVPALGFVWLPRPGQPGPALSKPRLKLAEAATVRNEFFEAELDPTTGGLRALRDLRTRQSHLGMQLVYHPGSTSRAVNVTVTHAGAALGEVTATGEILCDDTGRVLATFRHRLRAWVGRPALEMQLELTPTQPIQGYTWHTYFAAHFGWRDARSLLYRGGPAGSNRTSTPRPGSPEYLEIRTGSERVTIFTGGLPFARLQGHRALDVLLACEGETTTQFDFLLALDRDYPAPIAEAWLAPAPVVPVSTGPPSGLSAGSLAFLDLPSLVVSSLRPAPQGRALTVDITETAGFGGTADLTFALPPTRAESLTGPDTDGQPLTPAATAIPLEFSAHERLRIQVAWD